MPPNKALFLGVLLRARRRPVTFWEGLDSSRKPELMKGKKKKTGLQSSILLLPMGKLRSLTVRRLDWLIR